MTSVPVHRAQALPGDGQCSVGASKVTLVEGSDLPGRSMCGYSIQSRVVRRPGRPGEEEGPLRARALVLQSPSGARVAFLFADLWAPSYRLLLEVGNRAADAQLGLDSTRILFATTHTHSGPGRYFGNDLWNAVPVQDPTGSFDPAAFAWLAGRLFQALREACEDLRRGTVGVCRPPLWGVATNRSLPAFKKEGSVQDWVQDGFPGYGAPEGEDVRKAVDPRVSMLVAKQGERIRAVFATVACHATALGQGQRSYHPDWAGVASSVAEAKLRGAIVAFSQGGAGDASPLSPWGLLSSANARREQGPSLAATLGRRVAMHVASAAGTCPTQAFEVEALAGGLDLDPAGHRLGPPALGGAEDFRSLVYSAAWGTAEPQPASVPDDGSPQWPKSPGRGIFRWALDLMAAKAGPAWVPLLRLRVGDWQWVTVPAEPTAWAAFRLEQSLSPNTIVVGYAQEYVGYLTTEKEYVAQHYEGAMTAYGRCQHAKLVAAYTRDTFAASQASEVEFDHPSTPFSDAPPPGPEYLLSEEGTYLLWIEQSHVERRVATFGAEGERRSVVACALAVRAEPPATVYMVLFPGVDRLPTDLRIA